MKIAIISDIHENWHNLFLALDKIKELKCDHILCLGDMVNTGIAIVLNKQEIPVNGVWGNNDGDKSNILQKTTGEGSLTMSQHSYDFIERDNKKIFISHFDDIAPHIAKSEEFDLVCFGHNHSKSIEKIKNCIVANPGNIAATSSTREATFAIYNTQNNKVELITLENSITYRTELVESKFKELGFKR